jgi:hypothetical protein
VIKKEGITRDGVMMPVNFTNNTFTGGLHTTGSKVGGKDRMILSASDLVLKKKAKAPPKR